jgi:hypothetical protein
LKQKAEPKNEDKKPLKIDKEIKSIENEGRC